MSEDSECETERIGTVQRETNVIVKGGSSRMPPGAAFTCCTVYAPMSHVGPWKEVRVQSHLKELVAC